MDSSNAKMSEDKEVLRAQIESLIYGLEDAVETLKETSDTAHDMIARDLDLSIDITEELDKVPSKFVRKNDMQMKTEKLRVMTETAKQEVEDLAGSIGETLELLKKAALHPEGEKKESNS